ncbi:TPA: ead/Ea22-like family protein [Escherichia coli]|nr:ead/Ea22-like family protein [Escherichia coli]HBK0628498.1 ead/Ea22-like family protein [Escherichia coli]HBK0633333.1 ead/Ea22-like family protein [Escherichia coli]HBK0638340.1 ead/Ea22-like family protein [Escherichia coli]HBK0643288.1 ead/Ea22-like family protein [Escherichia coli]
MNKIDYQALREAAERAMPAMERLLMLPVDDDLLSEQELKDYCVDIDALNAFKFLAGPETVLALLDEINALEETRINDVCRIAELTKQLESAKSKLNEQREYYEGVISDGSKRIAELEKSEEQLISERDHAESALADMYFAATGDRPEWSNLFGFSDAVDAVVDRIADLEAKQPSPVVPEEKPMPNHLSMYAVDAVAAIAEVRGWNACRAAMLQGKSEQPQNAQQNIPENIPGGNSPVTPDGWVMVPKEPTQDMIKAWLSEIANFRGHAAGYRAALEAAPQLEVNRG